MAEGYTAISNGWLLHQQTLTDLMHNAIFWHLEHPKPDAVLNIETHLFNVTLVADDISYDLDLGRDVWLTRMRWSRLIKEYVPKEACDRFILQAKEIVEGGARDGATANMFFHDPDRYEKKHRWGGCMMGATFRGDNKKAGPATLTLYSRTTYMGYMGLLDAAVMNRIAAQITDGPVAFRWHIASQQLHAFKTLPYLYSQDHLMQYLEKSAGEPDPVYEPPTWREIIKWYRKVLEHWDRAKHKAENMLSEEKYGPFKRVKRRWMEHKRYLTQRPPPSLPLNQLTLDKMI